MSVGVPLRRRLLLLAAAGILPIAAMSGIALAALWSQQREQAARTGLEIARALSTAVDAELSRSLSVLQALATAGSLDGGNLRGFQRLARQVRATQPSWQSILVHDAGGNMVLSTAFPFGAKLPATVERESIAQAIQSQAMTVGFLARGPRGDFAFPLRVPAVRDGEVRYVLSAIVLPDNVLEVVNRQRLPSDWVVSVFDGKRQRVARSRQHREWLGGAPSPGLAKMMDLSESEGVGTTAALEGDRVYTAFSRSARTGWSVAIGIPASYVDAGAKRSVAVYGGGLLLSIVLGVLAALLIGGGIARPIEQLRSAAQALGRRERLLAPSTDIREIRQVADSLVTAADERTRGDAEREQLLRREQEARQIAEAANRSKDEFLAMLGHELRNPLGAIANAEQLLDARDAEARAHARAVIGRQVQHLARMTDDLLDAARAMTGKIVLHRHPLELSAAVAGSLSTLRASGRTGGRYLVQRLAPVWVEADSTRIEQIVGNLLGNALKFTPEQGTITLSVAREGADAVLRVSDDGVGMPPELTRRVFEPFVQGERPLDRSYGGLGIGLTLVRRLAELHGGSASAHSEGPGKGSVFTVRLPVAAAPARQASESAVPNAVAARDVLVVEDNADARETLQRLLELQGHRVRTAADGQAGLEAVRERMPELALIDIGLPVLDGYELARRIRSEASGARRPYLVALTGYGLPEDRNRTAAAGFDLHLVKPVDAAMLAQVLKR